MTPFPAICALFSFFCPQPPKKSITKKAPAGASGAKPGRNSKSAKNPLLERRPKNFGIGKSDMSKLHCLHNTPIPCQPTPIQR